MNGYGERSGNANLVSIIPNLQLKMGYRCLPDASLRGLTEASHFLDELLNFTPDPNQPYVGTTRSPTRAACTWRAWRPTRRRSSTSTRPRSATGASC